MADKWHELIYSYLKNDISGFRDLLVKMKDEGMSSHDAFRIFTEIRYELQREENEKDEDIILEVMDIIVGWCQPEWRVWDNSFATENQILYVPNFEDLVTMPYTGIINAMCWTRTLTGDFGEIVRKVELTGNITTIEPEELCALPLSEQGQLARGILLNDLELLKAHGASPVLNVINHYDRDETYPFFPTDVYSFHVDRSPIPTDTILCTYYGEPSEILPNAQGKQKILIPEIRAELKKLYHGAAEGFDLFLSEHFFDLHYQAEPDARIISLGLGNLWKLAVDHPESQVPPCLHRAPTETSGPRLLLIC